MPIKLRSEGPASGPNQALGLDEGISPTRRVGQALARLSRLLEQTAQAAGLSAAQYRVLLFVARRPQRASELAAQVDVRRPTLSSIVNGLERMDLVERIRVAEDGRGIRLALTDNGGAALERVEQELEMRLGAVLGQAGVDPAELALRLEAALDSLSRLPPSSDPGASLVITNLGKEESLPPSPFDETRDESDR